MQILGIRVVTLVLTCRSTCPKYIQPIENSEVVKSYGGEFTPEVPLTPYWEEYVFCNCRGLIFTRKYTVRLDRIHSADALPI